MNAYLIIFGAQNQTEAFRAFQDAWNTRVTHKVAIPGVANAFLVYSELDTADWYAHIKAAPTPMTGLSPVIIPIDREQLRGIEGVPTFLTEFVDREARAA